MQVEVFRRDARETQIVFGVGLQLPVEIGDHFLDLDFDFFGVVIWHGLEALDDDVFDAHQFGFP